MLVYFGLKFLLHMLLYARVGYGALVLLAHGLFYGCGGACVCMIKTFMSIYVCVSWSCCHHNRSYPQTPSQICSQMRRIPTSLDSISEFSIKIFSSKCAKQRESVSVCIS